MDVGDSTQLRQMKDYYSNSLREAEEQYDKQVKDLDKNYNERIQDREESYKKNIDKSQDNFARTQKLMNEDSQIKIEEQTDRFKRNLREIEKNFSENTRKDNLEMRDRLRNLSEEYQLLRKDNTDNMYETLYANEQAGENREKRNLLRYQNELDNFNIKSEEARDRLVESNNQDIRDINHRHEKNMNETVKYNTDRRNLITQENQKYVDELKRISKDDINRQKEGYERELATQKEVNNLKTDNLKIDYENLIQDQSNRLDRSRKLSEDKLLDELRKANFKAEIASSKDQRISQNLKDNDVLTKQRLKNTEDQVSSGKERRIESLNNEIQDLKDYYGMREKRSHQDYMTQTARDQYKANNLLENEQKRLIAEKQDVVDNSRLKQQMLIEGYRSELHDKDLNNQAKLDFEKERNARVTERERLKFDSTLQSVNRKSRDAIADIQEGIASERAMEAEKNRRDMTETKLDMKKDFEAKLATKDRELERKEFSHKDNFQEMVESYEKRIQNLQEKTANEINAIKNLSQSKHEDQIKDFRSKLKEITSENNKQILEIKNEFNRKLAEIKHEDDVILFETTNHYESTIDRMRKDYEKKISDITRNLKDQIKDQQIQNEINKESMRQQNDTRVAKLQIQNQKNIDTLTRRIKSERTMS